MLAPFLKHNKEEKEEEEEWKNANYSRNRQSVPEKIACPSHSSFAYRIKIHMEISFLFPFPSLSLSLSLALSFFLSLYCIERYVLHYWLLF